MEPDADAVNQMEIVVQAIRGCEKGVRQRGRPGVEAATTQPSEDESQGGQCRGDYAGAT